MYEQFIGWGTTRDGTGVGDGGEVEGATSQEDEGKEGEDDQIGVRINI